MRRISSDKSSLIRRCQQTFLSFSLVIIAFVAIPSYAADDSPARIWGELSLYPYLDRVDDDTDVTLTINMRLWKRLSYFSYQNYRGALHVGDARFLRSEQNLRWAISENLPIDLNLQTVMVAGEGNDQWLLGIGWRLHDTGFLESFFDRFNLTYRLTFQLKRFSSLQANAVQMEHFFKMRFPRKSERFYLSGFLDQTFNSEFPDTISNNPIVTEIQFGARILGHINAVAEYRINQIRTAENHNFALGIEYSFRW